MDTDDAAVADKFGKEQRRNPKDEEHHVFSYGANPVMLGLAIGLLASLAFLAWNSSRPTDRFFAIVLGVGAVASLVVSVPVLLIDREITVDRESITVPRGWFSREHCRLHVSEIQACWLHKERTYSRSWSGHWEASIRATGGTFTIDSRYCDEEAWDTITDWLRRNVKITE